MSCSACRIDVLQSFLYAFGAQHASSLQRHTLRTIQRRAIHSGTVFRINSTSAKSTASGLHNVAHITTSDHSYIPFATSTDSTSIKQSTFSSSFPRKRHVPTVVKTPEGKQGVDHLPGDTGLLETDVYEPDVILFTESKTRRLARDGMEDKTSSSGIRAGGMYERRSNRQDGRSYSGRRAPATIPERLGKGAGLTTEKVTAGVRPHNPQEAWGVQKTALEHKFGEQGWAPRKRLSPDALDGIRALNAQYPEDYSTSVLAEQFKVSPEAIRRILKSKWRPNDEEDVSRRQRWQKRGEAIWGEMVELGLKPPKKWRNLGIGRIHNADSEREKPRPRSQNAVRREVAPAVSDDLVKIPRAVPQADQPVRRSLSDRIL